MEQELFSTLNEHLSNMPPKEELALLPNWTVLQHLSKKTGIVKIDVWLLDKKNFYVGRVVNHRYGSAAFDGRSPDNIAKIATHADEHRKLYNKLWGLAGLENH